MRFPKRFFIVTAALAVIFMVSPSVFASTVFTAEIEGIPDSIVIVGFTQWFDVSDDFSFSGFTTGSSIPSGETGQLIGWGNSPAARIVGGSGSRQFQYGAFDQDAAILGTGPFPLKNGTLFQFSYEGTIKDIALVQFSDSKGNNFFSDVINVGEFGPDGVTYVVPIPSAVLLLGGGLLSLVAVRRRRR